jgi:hypothetical protein
MSRKSEQITPPAGESYVINIENAVLSFGQHPQMPPANDDPGWTHDKVFVVMNGFSNEPIGVFTSRAALNLSLAAMELGDSARIRIFANVTVDVRSGGSRDVTHEFWPAKN